MPRSLLRQVTYRKKNLSSLSRSFFKYFSAPKISENWSRLPEDAATASASASNASTAGRTLRFISLNFASNCLPERPWETSSAKICRISRFISTSPRPEFSTQFAVSVHRALRHQLFASTSPPVVIEVLYDRIN